MGTRYGREGFVRASTVRFKEMYLDFFNKMSYFYYDLTLAVKVQCLCK